MNGTDKIKPLVVDNYTNNNIKLELVRIFKKKSSYVT